MEITITIPNEVVAWAESQGLTPRGYVENLIAERHPPAKPERTKEQRMADLEEFFKAMAQHSDEIPQLPDEAFTRESFYRDHD